ncbi:unnamed protein product [Ectocarpus fasciculatus]
MSGGYASRLSEYRNKGVCGLPEHFETRRTLANKMNKLLQLVKESDKIVVLTGAGISTAAGISDFRGPNGVWTREMNGDNHGRKRQRTSDEGDGKTASALSTQEPVKSEPFQCLEPTYTHHALQRLLKANYIQYIVTQNVDGLHLRSGVPRSNLSILHGDCFLEKCENCGKEYFRDYDIAGLSFKRTGRFCDNSGALDTSIPSCAGALRDTILDWEDELPEPDFGRAEDICDSADLVIALGTSLRIVPAGKLPLRAKKYAIINLQQTPYDQDANVVIHHYTDTVMQYLLTNLDIGGNDIKI